MNDTVKKYNDTMKRIGVVLLLWTVFFYAFMLVQQLISEVLQSVSPGESSKMISSVLYLVAYLAAFILAAVLYHFIKKKKYDMPFRFNTVLRKDTFAWVFGGIACTLAFSTVNAVFVSILPFPESADMMNYAHEYMSDGNLILQFVTYALVPAFCEELLFRGVILSNLMPYGKASAIVISAVLFGAMHGNFYQFLYTTVAGIIIGTAYVMTDSIWCSVLIHMINNSIAFLQIAIYDRFSSEYAWIVWLAVECVIFTVGFICIAYLVTKKKNVSPDTIKPVFGESDKEPENCDAEQNGLEKLTFSTDISVSQTVKGFFTLPIIFFILIRVSEAILAFVLL